MQSGGDQTDKADSGVKVPRSNLPNADRIPHMAALCVLGTIPGKLWSLSFYY